MSTTTHYHLLSQEEGQVILPLCPMPQVRSCRYLISLDYDGTLKPEEAEVDAAFFELMLSLREHGVIWGINTGRSLQKLAAELAALPYQPDFVCTCERYVYLAGADGRLSPAAEHNAACHRANMELRHRICPGWHAALEPLRSDAWQLAADDPLSIEALNSAVLDELMPHLEPFAGAEVAIQRAGRFMRLSDANYSKGSALRYVQQVLQLPEKHLCLMGDGHNDIDAFRLFPQAFRAAPRTAHPDVICWLQKNNGYISPEMGVCEALHRWAESAHLPLHRGKKNRP